MIYNLQFLTALENNIKSDFQKSFNFITIAYQSHLNWIGREFPFNIDSMNNNNKLILHCLQELFQILYICSLI